MDSGNQSPIIQLKNITKIYGKNESELYALNNVSMSIMESSFNAIMGHSGSGKSTMLNILGCLDIPTSGVYKFLGNSVEQLNLEQRSYLRRKYFGFVFQGFNLLEHSSALDNVALPLLYRNIPKRERDILALRALNSVGLVRWKSHLPSQLSGGQQQRVAVARAIVTRPKVLFADEPTGNLDYTMSLDIMELLKELNKKHGITIIIVTHDQEIADFASRMITFKDGKIMESL